MGRSFLTILSRYGNAELVHDSPYNRPKAAGYVRNQFSAGCPRPASDWGGGWSANESEVTLLLEEG
jgi:hypothetical protein